MASHQQKALAQSALHYQAVSEELEKKIRNAYQGKIDELLEKWDKRFAKYKTGWDWTDVKRYGEMTDIEGEITQEFIGLRDTLVEDFGRYNAAVAKTAYERYIWEARTASGEAADKLKKELDEKTRQALEDYGWREKAFQKMLDARLDAIGEKALKTLRADMVMGEKAGNTWGKLKRLIGLGKGENNALTNLGRSTLGDTVAFARGKAAGYAKKQAMVAGEIWQNVLDGHEICPVCSPLHGLSLEEAQKKLRQMKWPKGWWKADKPPLHVNCYCYLMPVTTGVKAGSWTQFRPSQDWYEQEQAKPTGKTVPAGASTLADQQDEAMMSLQRQLGIPLRMVFFTKKGK